MAHDTNSRGTDRSSVTLSSKMEPGVTPARPLGSPAHLITSLGRRFAILMAIAAASAVALVGTESAGASGRAYVAGPGATVIQVDWQTVSRSSTVERLWVQVTGVTAGKVNSCGTGMSIWYNDANWTRRNLYQARDYCLFGPVWSYWTPTFAARRGSCVQVTYRMDGTWRNATTFCIK